MDFARPRHRKIYSKIFHYNNTFPMLPFYFLILSAILLTSVSGKNDNVHGIKTRS